MACIGCQRGSKERTCEIEGKDVSEAICNRRRHHDGAPHKHNRKEAQRLSALLRTKQMTMTVDEMAAELNISRPTAYELVKQERFPAFRIGQRILVNRAGLQRWIDAQCGGDRAA